ncbi:MAG: hypothetical protein OXJ53_04950 [Gammaproteobacteria bacterium]|nr:hypothetical protein [Gammaproteobacteria bacterium]MDE0273863.1 hypothetical protein [Gammaproteobacteria bacterium]
MTVNYTPQIIASFDASSIDRVLVIDDAYDPPESYDTGELYDLLEGAEFRSHVDENQLTEDERLASVSALTGEDTDDQFVQKSLSSLYVAYVKNRVSEVDPGGVFGAVKGAALDALQPVVELLGRCGDTTKIRCVGNESALDAYRELKPHLILMDFLLSPPSRPDRETSSQKSWDRKRSIGLLKSILEDDPQANPAVILMSTESVNEYGARTYRESLEGRVTAVRFGFLNKHWIKGSCADLIASGEAADVLMDSFGSFEFGQTLEAALNCWKQGAQSGLERLYRELRNFDVKDFAYLLRFRLYEEGEPFADYLEWFLGESLRAVVDDEVEWNADPFSGLNDKRLTEAIEGAHQGPSNRIAEFFHRMRFNSRENRARSRFAFGDLFVASNYKKVRMVITPDCDLVPRGDRPSANRVLTIGGVIGGLDEDKVFAGELILQNTPKAIKWDYKDLMTHKFSDLDRLVVEGGEYSYLGSMRAMSAQNVQKAALADLSRVGLAVPPTVDVAAPVTVYIRKDVNNQARVVELEGLSDPRAQVFMPRGGKDVRLRALFTSRFYRELVAIVDETDDSELLSDDRKLRKSWLKSSTKVRVAMLRDGLVLPWEGFSKMRVSVGSKKGKNWLEIVVDVSDKALGIN